MYTIGIDGMEVGFVNHIMPCIAKKQTNDECFNYQDIL